MKNPCEHCKNKQPELRQVNSPGTLIKGLIHLKPIEPGFFCKQKQKHFYNLVAVFCSSFEPIKTVQPSEFSIL